MNINNIKDATLAKLTLTEIIELGVPYLFSGIGLYNGELKTRYKGNTRRQISEYTYAFTMGECRVEFTRLANDENDEILHWAARIYDLKRNEYQTYPMGITGCDFIR